MSIDRAIESALSGIKTAAVLFSNASNSISNERDENYTKRTVVTEPNTVGSELVGVRVTSIKRYEDIFLEEAIRESGSKFSTEETIRHYLKDILSEFGNLNTAANPNLALDEAFSTLSKLSLDVENQSLKGDAVNKLKNLSSLVSGLAEKLYNYQYEIDREIAGSVATVNSLLERIEKATIAIYSSSILGGGSDNEEEKRGVLIKELAKYLNFNTGKDQDKGITLFLDDGNTLVGGFKSKLEYEPKEKNDFLIGIPYKALKLNNYSSAGEIVKTIEVISGGIEGKDISSNLKDGKIEALHRLRDKYIPKYLSMLNNLATNLKEQFNALHNQGSGYPPSSSYLATKQTTLSDYNSWEGKVKFAILDGGGNPVKRGDGSIFAPLILDLGMLNSGTGIGTPTVKTITDEFNRYFSFDPTTNRTALGTINHTATLSQNEHLIRDVKLVASSNLATPSNGLFSFDFELDNGSQFAANFEVLDVTVKDNTNATFAGYLATAVPGSFRVGSGDRTRTGQNITVDFTNGLGGPYTLEVKVRVVGDDGTIGDSTLTFQVNDNPIDRKIINNRYRALSVAGDAAIIPAGSNVSYAEAKLVNDNGDEVITDSDLGRLLIKTLSPDFKIVIQDETSAEKGERANTSLATNRGFGHYFGINDIFKENYILDRSAYDFVIRDDLVKNSSKLVTGKLTEVTPVYKNVTLQAQAARGTITFNTAGALPSAGDKLTIKGVDFTFVAGVPAQNQIQIGVDWATTITNIAATLNASNVITQGTVDEASYLPLLDGIKIVNKVTGMKGNSFNFGANFSVSNILVSLNDKRPAVIRNSSLIGGTDAKDITKIIPHAQKLSTGANQISNQISQLSNKLLRFDGGDVSLTSIVNFHGFTASILSTVTSDLSYSTIASEVTKGSYDNYFEKFRRAGGVDINAEVIEILKVQQSYLAFTKVLSVAKELEESFLKSF